MRAIDRHSYAIAIGGGAVLDVVGYAAAIFHRGVRHVLSNDRAGAGRQRRRREERGERVRHEELVGTFAPPFAIINDGSFIDRLAPREKRGGMAEAVKVALIRDRASSGSKTTPTRLPSFIPTRSTG